jgi:hypothetical protein
MRASDQDRDEAVLALSEHFAQGRLDQAEFDARMSAASEATYLHDLDPLFADLPHRPVPAVRVEAGARLRGPHGAVRRRRGGLPFPLAPLVFLAIVGLVAAFGFHALLFVVPVLWLAGGIARRRAWHRYAMTAVNAQSAQGPRWR